MFPKGRSIGLLGGTFDPPHFGHLNLAIEIKERKNLEEIWFVPANLSPFRDKSLASPQQRLKMLSLAVDRLPYAKILESEIHRPPPSYTIETLLALEQDYPEDQFFLILGEDSAVRFSEWRSAELIAKKIPLIIGGRTAEEGCLKKVLHNGLDSALIAERMREGFTEISLMDISSTVIRERLKQGLYSYHLLPSNVLDFIYENQLYFTSTLHNF